MRHYEIDFIVHPDQSEQVPAMIERYKASVSARGGNIHRVEDWGRRQMAYSIQKLPKAHYICMNIECDAETLVELEKLQTRRADFGTALDRVLEFMKNPHQIWVSGDFSQKQRVQRMVFARPIVIDPETGVGTAGLSLPFRICAESDGQRFKMVELRGIEPLASSLRTKRSTN